MFKSVLYLSIIFEIEQKIAWAIKFNIALLNFDERLKYYTPLRNWFEYQIIVGDVNLNKQNLEAKNISRDDKNIWETILLILTTRVIFYFQLGYFVFVQNYE